MCIAGFFSVFLFAYNLEFSLSLSVCDLVLCMEIGIVFFPDVNRVLFPLLTAHGFELFLLPSCIYVVQAMLLFSLFLSCRRNMDLFHKNHFSIEKNLLLKDDYTSKSPASQIQNKSKPQRRNVPDF